MRFSQILSGVTAVSVGSLVDLTGRSNTKSYQGVITGTAPFSASVNVEVSLDGTNWIVLTTMSLSNTTPTIGYTSTDAWPFVRGNVTAITGTGASVNLTVGL
jgi:hypothetical protein